MAHIIEEELKNIIKDIYVSPILTNSSRTVKREIAFFLGLNINELLNPLGGSDYLIIDEKENVDLSLNANININYINKNNILSEKILSNKNFKVSFIDVEDYENLKLEHIEKVLIDNISYNEPQYSDIYNKSNLDAYFNKNNKDNIYTNIKYFENLCLNSKIVPKDIKNDIKQRQSQYSLYSANQTVGKFNAKNEKNRSSQYINDSTASDSSEQNNITRIQKYNAFFLPWFYNYFKTSWKYMHLYNSLSVSPLGIICICSTKDNDIINLYKSMINYNIKKNNVYINSNIPKCIILLHVSNSDDDEIETEVQKIFVNIQSNFLNYKCHLLIIKARRFIDAWDKYYNNKESQINLNYQNPPSSNINNPNEKHNEHNLIENQNIYQYAQTVESDGKDKHSDHAQYENSKHPNELQQEHYIKLNHIQTFYANYLVANPFKEITNNNNNISVFKGVKDIEDFQKKKKELSTDLNKIYEYINSDNIIYISKNTPLYIDNIYFCSCLNHIDIISLKMFIHNFVKTRVLSYITTITNNINNLILSNKKSIKSQLKFMWKKTKFNFTTSDAALYVAEQTSNAIMTAAQNVLAPNLDMHEGKTHLKGLQITDGKTANPNNSQTNYSTYENESENYDKDPSSSVAGNDNYEGALAKNKEDGNLKNVSKIENVEESGIKTYNKDSLENMYKTLSDIYFILEEYELSYNILKICISEFKHSKEYAYLASLYELFSLCIFNMNNVNKKDILYYLDMSYQMYYKIFYLNNMFICSILNYYMSIICDIKTDEPVNILINANFDFSCVDDKISTRNNISKLEFQINNIRSALLLEQITYSYKKPKPTKNKNIIDKARETSMHSQMKEPTDLEKKLTYNNQSSSLNSDKNGLQDSASGNDSSVMYNTKNSLESGAQNCQNMHRDSVYAQNCQSMHRDSVYAQNRDRTSSLENIKKINLMSEIEENDQKYKSRKYLFDLTLAGHTFNKCGFKKLALFCYSKSLKKYEKKKMKHIYEHLHFMMARQAFSINLYYEALQHYICILNSISKYYEQSYILNKNIDIYSISVDKEINFIREFAYVYKIYMDKVLNLFTKPNGKQINSFSEIDSIFNDTNHENDKDYEKKKQIDGHENSNTAYTFNKHNPDDIIKPLNLKIPLICQRNDESLFANSIYVSKTNIYKLKNNNSINNINYFDIFENNLFKIKNYNTTIQDMYSIMTKDINHISNDHINSLNYLFITYKNFINSVYNNSIDLENTEVCTTESDQNIQNDNIDASEKVNQNDIHIDTHSCTNKGNVFFQKSVNISPFSCIENKNLFISYINELREKLKNSIEFSNNAQIKNIYQTNFSKQELQINNKYIQYASKGDFIFVTFTLINPLHTKVECQGTHLCAYFYNQKINQDIIVEKKILILEPKESRTFTLYLRPLRHGLLFISGIVWDLFGLVKTYQNLYTHGLKQLNKKFDKMHKLKYDEIFNVDDDIQKNKIIKKLYKEHNKYIWSNNIGMLQKRSLKKTDNYEIDHRLLYYIYDKTYLFDFIFENIYSKNRKKQNNYEIDLIELLEGEEMEIKFKIVNHSSIPLTYLNLCITPCNLFTCYKVDYNDNTTFHILKNTSNSLQKCDSYKEEQNSDNTIFVDNELYCEEFVDINNCSVFKQKFKNKNIQNIKIKGNLKKHDTFILYLKIDSTYSGFHKCLITMLCGNDINNSSNSNKQTNNTSLSYPDILLEKKESSYLFLKMVNVIPIIKLITYPLNKHNSEQNFIYFLFHNLCKNGIYLYNLHLEHNCNNTDKGKHIYTNFTEKKESKEDVNTYIKLFNFYSSNILFIKKNQTLTSLFYSDKSIMQNNMLEHHSMNHVDSLIPSLHTSFFVNINWISNQSGVLKKGYIKKKITFSNDILTFSVDPFDKDIFINNQNDKLIKIGINIHNNSNIDIFDCYVHAREMEAMHFLSTVEQIDDKASDTSFSDENTEPIDGKYMHVDYEGQNVYEQNSEQSSDHNSDFSEIYEHITKEIKNIESENFIKNDHIENQMKVDKIEEKNKIISHYSYKSILADEINIQKNSMSAKMNVSKYNPITESYYKSDDPHFEVSVMNYSSLSNDKNNDHIQNMEDKLGYSLEKNSIADFSLGPTQKYKLIDKKKKRLYNLFAHNTYIHNYNSPNDFLRLTYDEINKKENKNPEQFISINGFTFVGIIQKHIKKIKKHTHKKIFFNILFTKEGIYNINKFHVVFKLNGEFFMFKPLNELIVQIHK
ncbi:trafficking protein particle complex subunit 8, putative [Plasmodium chabaudi chabaudi]|uniref:Trafficking protein particle complex subunit 8, putative n=1 Tax=Plasmodium chabaudi chabaudi TaxID=31271 RepID=A0A1D3RXD7_PLACU|nr:trafficking protein particle complex subunit 8, putative [Plasmodium chabaudi chabaudi]